LLARLLLAAALLVLGAAPSARASPRDNVRATLRWDITPAQLRASCTREIARAQRRLDAVIAARAPRTAASVLLPLENITADLSDGTAVDSVLFDLSPSAQVRQASQACANQLDAFQSAFSARPDVYQALRAVAASRTATAPYQTKLLGFYLVGARRSGAALKPAARKEFVALENELGKIELEFAANLHNDKTAITITQAQIAGLAPDFVVTLKKNANGTLVVPVNESTYGAFMRNERDAAARKAFYIADRRRGGEQNVKLLERAIAIRDKLAHLLGFKNWATYRLADKMARDPQRVVKFLGDLDARLLPGARAERAVLARLKAVGAGRSTARIDPWDFDFYDNALRKTKYAVDVDEVKAYFPVEHTVEAVLGIYSHMLGVTFHRGADDAWAPGVVHYTVSDTATGRFIGDTYFDLYPRPGKYSHFANFPLLANRLLPNGKTRAPMAAIVGNWPKPAPGKPALLTHAEVETFFHEFGHNMAALLATAPYETLSDGFRQDFVEAPSQMLENFVWQPEILRKLSSRWDTGAPMPQALIRKIVAARYVDQDSEYVGQAFLAVVDMTYHTSGPKVDTTNVWATLLARMTPAQFVEGTYPQASFEHLMGGYDAGYYGYLWSRVYAQDMFTRFQRQGIESQIVGRAYRNDILAPAMTYEPDQEVRTFLGRPMSPDAFYASLGLKPTAQK
jgi:thimet oligopeptidase